LVCDVRMAGAALLSGAIRGALTAARIMDRLGEHETTPAAAARGQARSRVQGTSAVEATEGTGRAHVQSIDGRRERDDSRTGRVPRAADADDTTRPDAAIQTDGHGIWLGRVHAAPEHAHLFGDVHPGREARRRHALPVVRLLWPAHVEPLCLVPPLRADQKSQNPSGTASDFASKLIHIYSPSYSQHRRAKFDVVGWIVASLHAYFPY